MGVDHDITRSPFYEAFGDEASERTAKLTQLDAIADRLDARTDTQADRDAALHILVDLALGRSNT